MKFGMAYGSYEDETWGYWMAGEYEMYGGADGMGAVDKCLILGP